MDDKQHEFEQVARKAHSLAFPGGNSRLLQIYDYQGAIAASRERRGHKNTSYISLDIDGSTYTWSPDGFSKEGVLFCSGWVPVPTDESDEGWRVLKETLDSISTEVRCALAQMEKYILEHFRPLSFSYIHGLYIHQDVKVTKEVKVTYKYELVEGPAAPTGNPITPWVDT